MVVHTLGRVADCIQGLEVEPILDQAEECIRAQVVAHTLDQVVDCIRGLEVGLIPVQVVDCIQGLEVDCTRGQVEGYTLVRVEVCTLALTQILIELFTHRGLYLPLSFEE